MSGSICKIEPDTQVRLGLTHFELTGGQEMEIY